MTTQPLTPASCTTCLARDKCDKACIEAFMVINPGDTNCLVLREENKIQKEATK
jgi:hypothetical protein